MKYFKHLVLLFIGISFIITGAMVVFAQEDDDSMLDDPALIARGREVFLANGCTGCHGQDAEGTDIAPALAGHNEFQVRRQVRSPAGIMLVFSPTQIPAEDLTAVVAYILSLEPMEGEEGDHHMHEMGAMSTGDIVFAYHWLLWLDLEAGNVEAAIHHTGHILELVEGPHLAAMQPVMTLLGEGDIDGAKAIVEPMVTDVGEFSHDPYVVGLQLTYMAANAGDQEVTHEFALDLTEQDLTEEQMAIASEVLEHVETCDLSAAMMIIETELGDQANFIPADMTMTMDEHSDESMDMESDQHSDESMDMESDDHTEETMDTEATSCGESDHDAGMSGDQHSDEGEHEEGEGSNGD